jgi:hypothetical protein
LFTIKAPGRQLLKKNLAKWKRLRNMILVNFRRHYSVGL